MKAALLGLTQSGKSTILSTISGKALPPVGSASIEEAIVPVPDARLDWLNGLYKPKKKVHATIDVLDLPGFSFIDEKGRAAARRQIGQIRTVDMLVLVIRAFENPSVAVYRDKVDWKRDLAELRTELLLSDLELVTTRIENLKVQVKKPTKTQAHDKAELALQERLQEAIESEKPISTAIQNEEEMAMVRSLGFLTMRPMAIVVNVDENGISQKIEPQGSIPVATMSAKIEQELAQLDPDSRTAFMSDLGITESAAEKFVQMCYSALGLISFLTVGPDEVRAWPIKAGTTAVDAAGKIHTDIKRGFIRAETMSYADLKELGDEKAVKAAGKMRLEGKEYVVKDGDIMNFRFNV